MAHHGESSARAHDPVAENRFLRKVLKQVPAIVWATNRNLRLTYVQARIPAVKIDSDDAIGRTIQEFIGASDFDNPMVTHHIAALAGRSQSFRYRYQDRFLDILIDPLLEERGEIAGCVGVAVDVTDFVKKEDQLTNIRRRFDEAQEVAHVGSFEWDLRSDRVSWSDELHRICGTNPDQFEGTYRAFLSCVHPDDRDHAEEVITQALRMSAPFEYDHRMVRPDRSVRFLHTRGSVVVDELGMPVRMVGSCWDATAITETTRRLKHSVSLLEATINATADGLLIVDLADRVVSYNRRFIEQWQLPPDLVERRNDVALVAFALNQLKDPERFQQRVRELYATPEKESLDILTFKDGRVFERFSAPQRLGAQIIGRVWSFRDVTARERAERQAKEAIAILAMAAHDVRNPLGTLDLQLEVMRNTHGNDPSSKTLLAQIADCRRLVTRASTLLTSLLDIAQIGASKLTLKTEEVDLVEMTRAIIDRSRIEIEAARCSVALRADASVVGLWDPVRLDQIITNLLSNALKYGREKPIEIEARRNEAVGALTIRDHGIGISAADQTRIFGRFERAVTDGRGAGLGLWIARRLARAMGGRITVTSRVGDGSAFTLELPLAWSSSRA